MTNVFRKSLFVLAATGVALASVSCSAQAGQPGAATRASESERSTPSTEGTESSEKSVREVPAECSALDLKLGGSLDGAALGECVSRALASYGSGVMYLTGDTNGRGEFTYDPEYSVQASMDTDMGEMKLVYTGGEMWVDQGAGFIQGDMESEVFDEQVAGLAAELYRVYADLEQTAQLIRTQPGWRIEAAQEVVTQPTGDSVTAYRIVNTEPFVWNEISVQEYVIWFGEDWVPVGTQATTAVAGFGGTNGQQFTNLGEPVVIEVPTVG